MANNRFVTSLTTRHRGYYTPGKNWTNFSQNRRNECIINGSRHARLPGKGLYIAEHVGCCSLRKATPALRSRTKTRPAF